MEKTNDGIAVSIDSGNRKDGSVANVSQPAQQSDSQNLELKGRFHKYTSGYWALALPALSVRYAFEAASNLAATMGHSRNLSAKFTANVEKGYALGVGAFMMGVTAFYSYRTYQDLTKLFAEPLAWEFKKKPEEVGLRDMLKSENVLVKGAFRKFLNYNTRRVIINSVFFSSFLPKSFFAPTPDAAVKLGVASNALYLMTDVVGRKETFFERLQTLIDSKINHVDKVGDMITTIDLMNLHYIRERELNPQFKPPRMNTQEWHSDEAFFGRMAELMNQTYGNKEVKEHADFTVSKYLYLFGMGLAQSGDRQKDLAYVELANREGIPAVKQAVALGQIPMSSNTQKRIEPSEQPVVGTDAFHVGEKGECNAKKQKTATGAFTEKLATENRNNGNELTTRAPI